MSALPLVANFEELVSGLAARAHVSRHLGQCRCAVLLQSAPSSGPRNSPGTPSSGSFSSARPYCTKANRHIVIDGLVLALPDRLRACLQVLVDVLTLALMGTLVYYGWVLTVFTTQPTSTLYVPMSVVYVVVPLSALLIALRSLGVFVDHIRKAVRGSESAA